MADARSFLNQTRPGGHLASRALRRWLVRTILIALLVVAWAASSFMPGMGPAAAAEGNPLIVGGFQVGDRMQGVLDEIATALDGVKDAETARTAVETFSEAERQTLELEPFLLLLSHEGKTAIAAQVTGALIIMKPTVEKLVTDSAIGPVLKPGFDKLVDKFKSLGS